MPRQAQQGGQGFVWGLEVVLLLQVQGCRAWQLRLCCADAPFTRPKPPPVSPLCPFLPAHPPACLQRRSSRLVSRQCKEEEARRQQELEAAAAAAASAAEQAEAAAAAAAARAMAVVPTTAKGAPAKQLLDVLPEQRLGLLLKQVGLRG